MKFDISAHQGSSKVITPSYFISFQLQPLLGVWQSLIESVSDYLPGHSGAPILLQGSFTSFSGTSDTSDETDSAVVMEDNSAGNNSSNGPEDPMEGLVTIQARAKEAQASGVILLDEIVELIARGENIRNEANGIANSVLSVDGDLVVVDSEAEKRMSCASLSSLLARMACKLSCFSIALSGGKISY